jgi:multidrug efflux system membrane fusion protein
MRTPKPRPIGSAGVLVRAALAAVLILGAGVAGYRYWERSGAAKADPGRPMPAAVPVTIGRAETRDMPVWLSGIGSVQPLNAVTVKVRVDGQLDQVAFAEGQEIHSGDLLAQIDPRPFRAQVKLAQANRAKDLAQLANARVDLARFGKLAAMGAGPSQNVDTLRAQVATLEATVQGDEASVDMAQLQLGFTRITAPLDGRTGLRLVDPGSIVHATDLGGIVTITQMRPIAVLFSLPQDDLSGVLSESRLSPLRVDAYSRDGSHRLAVGALAFVDSEVDPQSGQVRLKANFRNDDRALWPGELVSAQVLLRTEKGVTVVPVSAVQRGEVGPYVYVVGKDQTANPRPLTLGETVDRFTVVRTGIAAGEQVIVDGQYRVAPGTKVRAIASTGSQASASAGAGAAQ